MRKNFFSLIGLFFINIALLIFLLLFYVRGILLTIVSLFIYPTSFFDVIKITIFIWVTGGLIILAGVILFLISFAFKNDEKGSRKFLKILIALVFILLFIDVFGYLFVYR